jgi:cell division protein FtsW
MAGILLRATFEINRALDARRTSSRLPAAVAIPDASVAANSDEAEAA